MNKKNTKRAKKSIDRLRADVNSWLVGSFMFLAKTRVKMWPGLLVIAFFGGVMVTVIWAVDYNIQTKSWAADTRTATLSWNPNTETDLAGYRIYYGTSTRTGSCPSGGMAGYQNKVDVGKVNSYTVSSLSEGKTYYFSTTAYDTSGNESCFSSEVTKAIPVSADTAPPSTPANLAAAAVSSTQVELSWSASTDDKGVAGYKVYRNGTQVAGVSTPGYTDSGLTPSTAYTYAVSAYDAAGNESSRSNSISATTSSETPDSSVCTDNLVGYWKFNETSGTTAGDSSGNNIYGTLANGPRWAVGKVNGALAFDGLDDYIAITPNPLLNNLKAFTYSVWIRPTGWGEKNNGRILSKEAASSPNDVNLFLMGGTDKKSLGGRVFNTSGNNFSSASAANSLVLNRWYHIVMTYDDLGDRIIHLYLNGKEVNYAVKKKVNGALNLTDNPFIVGNRGSNDRTFKGKLDDVRIFSRALTPSEVQELYNCRS